jgi:TPR repeat protein
MALLEKAAGQGHAYAMNKLGSILDKWKEHEQAVEWYTKGSEAGLPKSMFNVAVCLDAGEGVAAPDYPAAADWYRRAADAGHGEAAFNLAEMYTVGRGRVRQMPATSSSTLYILDPRFLT